MLSPWRRRAFTLVELLVVIAVVAVLIGLLLPAVQKVRESANRTKCLNNLKQLALGLHVIHENLGRFPPGGTTSPTGGYGFSWWVSLLPAMEQSNVFNGLNQTGHHLGWVGGDSYGGNATNRNFLRNLKIPLATCPSSTLPQFGLTHTMHNEANVFIPTYTAVAGAVNAPGTTNSSSHGQLSVGGVMTLTTGRRIVDILDGSSTTLVIAEQSDWCRNAAGTLTDCRSDCAHGFSMGPGNDGWGRAFNTTSVRHRINEKSTTAAGVVGNCGTNSAIQSVHIGGANVAFADGSVRFLQESLPTATLYNLANRADGIPVEID